jgi:tetratricopeptide (TPR) repeat protein
MRTLPHVTVVGDFTAGCFADPDEVTLPNGWTTTVSRNRFVDGRGVCWEGIGVPPDLMVRGHYGPVGDKDPALETAVALIVSGALGPPNERDDGGPVTSLVDMLAAEIESEGIDRAIAALRERKDAASGGEPYLDYFELISLGKNLLASDRRESGEQVLLLAAELFPDAPGALESLGWEYLRQDRKDDAFRAFEKCARSMQARTTSWSHHLEAYLSDALARDYATGGIRGLDRQYLALQEAWPGRVDASLLNRLGYSFLNAGLTAPAVEVLERNAGKYPWSAEAFDSLGEAYAKAGERKKAIRSYERSLRLNPENGNATSQLEVLRQGN